MLHLVLPFDTRSESSTVPSPTALSDEHLRDSFHPPAGFPFSQENDGGGKRSHATELFSSNAVSAPIKLFGSAFVTVGTGIWEDCKLPGTSSIAIKLRKIAASIDDLATALEEAPIGNGKAAPRRRRRSTEEATALRKQLKAERKAGVPVAELAKKHGITSAYVYMLG